MSHNRPIPPFIYLLHFIIPPLLFTNAQPPIQPTITNSVNTGLSPFDSGSIIPSQENIRKPSITDVSAMCAEEGITAQIMFDGAFYGKIYSKDYATVHDCVYYNSYDMNMVLFTIPNTKCGTQIDRSAINIVNRIENEVYVQYDKDTQTNADRRFLFICDRASSSIDSSNQVVTPKEPVIINNDKFKTIEPTRIVVTQNLGGGEGRRRDIVMEIQEGRGPYQPAVTKPVKLGDLMTLVVKQDKSSAAPGSAFNMFVHSCYAADGSGSNKVLLIDDKGCTARPQVAGRMQRVKTADGATLYYFRISAFKFPGPSDVYFTCSVDVCAECDYALLCPEGTSRKRRYTAFERASDFNAGRLDTQLQLHDYVKILDQLESLREQQAAAYMEEHPNIPNSGNALHNHSEQSEHALCLDLVTVYTFISLFVILFLVTLCILAYLFVVLRRLSKVYRKNEPISSSSSASSTSSTTYSTPSNRSTTSSTHGILGNLPPGCPRPEIGTPKRFTGTQSRVQSPLERIQSANR